MAVGGKFEPEGVHIVGSGAYGGVEGRPRPDGLRVPAPGCVQAQVAEPETARPPQGVDQGGRHTDAGVRIRRRQRDGPGDAAYGVEVVPYGVQVEFGAAENRIQGLVHHPRFGRTGEGMPPLRFGHRIEQLGGSVLLLHPVDDVNRMQC